MANVFISYAHGDKERIIAMASALEAEGLSVWWDSDLVPGRHYRKVIADQLALADCVIVAWTAAALESDWVQDEAEEGRQRGVLIPVLLEPVRAPAGFRQVQSANLSQWTGNPQHPEFRALLFAVRSLVQVARANGPSAASPPGAVEFPPAGEPAPRFEPTSKAVVAPTAIGASDQPQTPGPLPAPTTKKRPRLAVLTLWLADLMFGWPWWVGVAVLMGAVVTGVDAIEHEYLVWPYGFCTMPLAAGAVATAGRRVSLEAPAKAIAMWCFLGAGLAVGLFVLMSSRDWQAAMAAFMLGALAASLVFALAAGGLILGRSRRSVS